MCRVIAPMLAGETNAEDSLMPQDDVQYVIDLGLVTSDKPRRIANAIYREIIPREKKWYRTEEYNGRKIEVWGM